MKWPKWVTGGYDPVRESTPGDRWAEAAEAAAERARLRAQECMVCGKWIGNREEVLIVHLSTRNKPDELDAIFAPHAFVHVECIINKAGAKE